MTAFNFVLAQLNPTVGDLEGNVSLIEETCRNALKENSVVVFPESVTTGYPADDLILNNHFIDTLTHRIDTFIKTTKGSDKLILLPTPWREGGKIYNAVLAISNGQILQVIQKHHLPNYGVFDEKRVFDQGALPEVLEYKGVKLGIMICEDMWQTDASAHLKAQGAELLIVPNGSPFQDDIQDRRLENAKARVSETGLPLIYVNQVGGQDELVFDGRSFVMDQNGDVIAQLPAFEEINVEFNFDAPAEITKQEPLEIIYKAVTTGLRDYVRKNNFSGVLIGLSGGIDSALSAAIAVDALGAENVHCVMMPSPYTSQESLDDAQACADALGVQLDSIPIEGAMEAYSAMLAPHIDADNAGTTFENIQSRARGVTLMALSNATGKMVLSTGNKSEMAVGYATLYGDMCGGFNALKDLYKMQVYALSEWRNQQSPVIPQNIIDKAPSAELKPDQTDQDSLPPYEVLDNILMGLIEDNLSPDEIARKHGYDKALVLKIWRMLDIAEYKRKQAPPGVKITRKAFGRDRRYPITNKFRTE